MSAIAASDWFTMSRLRGRKRLSIESPSVLLAASKWWPLSARLALELQRCGCQVSTLCPSGHPLRRLPGLASTAHYGGIASLRHLRRSLRALAGDSRALIIPCDDGVVAQLHALHRDEPDLRALIERSLGPAEYYPIVSSRLAIMELAATLGIAAPATRAIGSSEDIRAFHRDFGASAFVKLNGESGGNGVRLGHSPDESLAAWRQLRRRPSLLTAWKRLAIDRDPLALWMRRHYGERELTIQTAIRGRPANSMIACARGQVLGIVSVSVVVAESLTGAATIVRRIDDERLAANAARLAAKLQLNGFYGLDYVIDADTGTPYLIELNPRCTQLGHLQFPGEMSLAASFAAALGARPRSSADHTIWTDHIALFPQALAAGDICHRHLESSYYDVPWDAPLLHAELRLPAWPRRRWASKLYHACRPAAVPTPAIFEEPAAHAAIAPPLRTAAARR